MENSGVVETRQFNSKVVILVFAIAMIAAGFSLFKLIPLQQPIMERFGIAEGAYGYLNSAQNWVTLCLMIPLGYMFRKMKARFSLAFCCMLIIVGTVIEIFAPIYPLFVIGRVFDGGGTAVLNILIFSLATNVAKPERRAMVVSLMVSMTMVAQVIYVTVAPQLMMNGMGLYQLFILLMVIQIICFLLLVFLTPKEMKIYGNASAQKATKEQTMRIYKNKNVWFVTIAYTIFNLCIVSFASFQMVYFMQRGMTPGGASMVVSMSSLVGIPGMIIWGVIADKLKTNRKIAIFSMFATAAAMVMMVKMPLNLIAIYVIFFGFAPRSIVGLTNASSVDLVDQPSDIPIVNSLRDTINALGAIVGGILMGYGLQFLGYDTTILIFGALAIVGAVCWILAKKVH